MKRRIVTCLLAVVLTLSLLTVAAAGAEKRPWEDAYRAAIKTTTNKDKSGWTAELVDLNLDGTPELLLANLPGTGGFQLIVSMFTFENNAIRSVTIQNELNTFLCRSGTFEDENFSNYTAYRNNVTGAIKVEGYWFLRNGYREQGYNFVTCTFENGVYSQQTQFTEAIHDNVSTYYIGSQVVSYNQYLSAFRARNNGWTRITPYSYSSIITNYGSKVTDAQIDELFAGYADGQPRMVGGFADVMSTDYFADPVVWAATHDPQITNGTTATTFSPNSSCTRGQVVTFLWRASGCPEPKSAANPFGDVNVKEYYGKAVLWAVENGITNGMSQGVFAPDATVTRGQVVTFLWRTEHQPAVSGSTPFTDVPADAYYADAVAWAVANDITNGTTATTFSPDTACTRGQIVTFLYRDMA